MAPPKRTAQEVFLGPDVIRERAVTKYEPGRPFTTPTQWEFSPRWPEGNGGKDPTKPNTPAMPIGKLPGKGKPFRYVGSPRHPLELFGHSFKPDDLYGSVSATMAAHKVWNGKEPEPEFWMKRPGFGKAPERKPPIVTHPQTSPPGKRLVLGSPTRSASASYLNTSESASGLSLSNATVRLCEHPLAVKLHKNGINVKTSVGSGGSARGPQPAGGTATRPATPSYIQQALDASATRCEVIGSSASLKRGMSASTTSLTSDPNQAFQTPNAPRGGPPGLRASVSTPAFVVLDASHRQTISTAGAPGPAQAASRPTTPSALCATFGLHPAFKSAGTLAGSPRSSRPNSRGSLLAGGSSRPASRGTLTNFSSAGGLFDDFQRGRNMEHSESKATIDFDVVQSRATTPSPKSPGWRGGGARPYPQDAAVRSDKF